MATNLLMITFYSLIFVFGISCKKIDRSTLNLDFENVDSKRMKASGWLYTENEYKISLCKEVVNHGRYSLKIESPFSQNQYNDRCWVQIMFDSIPGNQKIRFSGYLKNEKTNCDSLGLFLFCKSPDKDLYEILKSENFKGTHGWQEYSIEVTTPNKTEYVLLGIQGIGSGVIWADNLKLYLNGKQIKNFPASNNFETNLDEVNWLKNHVVSLKTFQAETSLEDLLPLKETLKDARIIALGENSHGTSEIFEMKHRFLEFLTQEMGFKNFLIESAMFESDSIDDYVQYGYGNPKELMRNLTPAWNTQEFLDIIMWMRKYNIKNSSKIHFSGIDMTSCYGALKKLTDFAINDMGLKILSDSLQIMLSNFPYYENQAEIKRLQILKIRKCNQVLLYLQNSLPNSTVNIKELQSVIQAANIIKQFLEYYSNEQSGRDEYMAENVSWILDNDPTAKLVLWAHNEHISKIGDAMGNFLSKKYGDKYYSIGFVTNKGQYTASIGSIISTKNKFIDAKPGSYEYNFNKIQVPLFFLDLRAIKVGEPDCEWLGRRLHQRTLGAVASEVQFFPAILDEKFDAVIFIDSTTSAKTFLPTNN